MRSVDLVVVVTVPGLGDEIQAIKAGIMEIADVFVVNKADREGVDRTVRDLRSALEMSEDGSLPPPVVKTVASRGEGVDELIGELTQLGGDLTTSGVLDERRFQHLRLRVANLLRGRILVEAERALDLEGELRDAWARREDPHTLSDRLFRAALAGARDGELG